MSNLKRFLYKTKRYTFWDNKHPEELYSDEAAAMSDDSEPLKEQEGDSQKFMKKLFEIS